MRPTEFTPEAIIQAGQDLLTAGRNITGFALRQKVGGGNPNRLKQVWDEFQSSRSVTEAMPVAELPVEVAEEVAAVSKALTDRLAHMAIELNDKAVKAAERRVGEVIRTAGEQREQAERELADASQTVEDLENALDKSTGQVSELENNLAQQVAAKQALAVELAQVRERGAAFEEAAKTVCDDLARAKAELAKQEKATVEANQAAAVATEKANGLAERLAEAKTRIEAAERQAKEWEETAHESAQAYHIVQEGKATLAAKLEAMTERAAKADARAELAEQEARQAGEHAAELKGQLAAISTSSKPSIPAPEAQTLKPSRKAKTDN